MLTGSAGPPDRDTESSRWIPSLYSGTWLEAGALRRVRGIVGGRRSGPMTTPSGGADAGPSRIPTRVCLEVAVARSGGSRSDVGCTPSIRGGTLAAVRVG